MANFLRYQSAKFLQKKALTIRYSILTKCSHSANLKQSFNHRDKNIHPSAGSKPRPEAAACDDKNENISDKLQYNCRPRL